MSAPDFAPIECTRELVATSLPGAGRLTAAAVLLCLVIAVTWSSLARVDVLVSARGVIVPAGGTKTIQSNGDGIVRAIHVADGERVRAGAVLIELDPATQLAEHRRIESELHSVNRDIERLRAMLANDGARGAEFIAQATRAERDLQERRFLAEVERHQHRLAEIESAIRMAALTESAAAEARRKLSLDVEFRRARIAEREQIVREGLLPRQAADADRHELAQVMGDLRIKELEQGAAKEDQTRLREQERREIDEYRSSIYVALDEALRSQHRLEQEQSIAQVRYRNLTILAPVDGVVQELLIHTVGGSVRASQALMTLVPSSADLQVDAWVDNRDGGEVRGGQHAELRVDAFDYARFGVLQGTVINVSNDVVAAGGRSAADDSRYLARIRLDATSRFPTLKPGMTVDVGINVGERRVIEYFLSPVLGSLQRPFADK